MSCVHSRAAAGGNDAAAQTSPHRPTRPIWQASSLRRPDLAVLPRRPTRPSSPCSCLPLPRSPRGPSSPLRPRWPGRYRSLIPCSTHRARRSRAGWAAKSRRIKVGPPEILAHVLVVPPELIRPPLGLDREGGGEKGERKNEREPVSPTYHERKEDRH